MATKERCEEMVQGGEVRAAGSKVIQLNPQPSQASEVEELVALTASPAAATPRDAPCGYDDAYDRENNFEVAHIACVPLTGDTGETIGVLTVMRGWPLTAPPAQHVIYSDAKYAPFSRCDFIPQHTEWVLDKDACLSGCESSLPLPSPRRD